MISVSEPRSPRAAAHVPDASAITLGGMGLPDMDADEAQDFVRSALELGITSFDTADAYGSGESERRLGGALGADRDRVVIRTKVGLVHRPDGAVGDLRAGEIRRRVEESLTRLGVERIDVVYAHMPDPVVSIEEVVSAFADLVDQGKVVHYGWSNHPVEEIAMAAWAADRCGGSAATALQLQYSLLERSAEGAVLPLARRLGLEVAVWGPLGSGWLTTAATSGRVDVSDRRFRMRAGSFDPAVPENQRKAQVAGQAQEIAEMLGISVSGLALAFVLSHPAVSTVIAGPATPKQLEESVAAASVRLDGGVLDALDELVKPGEQVNARDAGWTPLPLRDPALRRRQRLG